MGTQIFAIFDLKNWESPFSFVVIFRIPIFKVKIQI